jgi:hypothetical protein
MLKQFPIRLSIKVLFAAALMIVAVRLLVYPLFIRVQDKIPAIWSHYSGKDATTAVSFERDKAALVEFEQNAVLLANGAKKSSAYYDFLQEVLKKHGIMTVKINSGNQTTIKNVKREDYALNFSTTYHTVGAIVSDLENGPFYCSVKPMHILSKSLLNYTLDVEMSLSFYRIVK